MFVKVCGLTAREDVVAAVEAGADAVGFVMAPSPRRLDRDVIRSLVPSAEHCMTVLLTVGAAPDALLEMTEATGVSGVQPYGEHAVEARRLAREAGLFVLCPIGVSIERPDLGPVPPDQMPLLDSLAEGKAGGTGTTFDWSLVASLDRDFVLAGGLGPDNVAAAVAGVRPWGVDASSGLESAPGRKDAGRIRAFVEGARQ